MTKKPGSPTPSLPPRTTQSPTLPAQTAAKWRGCWRPGQRASGGRQQLRADARLLWGNAVSPSCLLCEMSNGGAGRVSGSHSSVLPQATLQTQLGSTGASAGLFSEAETVVRRSGPLLAQGVAPPSDTGGIGNCCPSPSHFLSYVSPVSFNPALLPPPAPGDRRLSSGRHLSLLTSMSTHPVSAPDQ